MKVKCSECGSKIDIRELVNGIRTDRKGNNIDIMCKCGHLLIKSKKVPSKLKTKRVLMAGLKSTGHKAPSSSF